MTKMNIAMNVIGRAGGIARTCDLNDAGLKNYDISRLASDGSLYRVRHGYYSKDSSVSDEQIIAAVFPEGIICMESAMYYYGYLKTAPAMWDIALPRSITRSKLSMNCVAFQPHFIREEIFALGKNCERVGGVMLDIYDRERTICDCFRHRRLFTPEVFSYAVNSYMRDEMRRPEILYSYADEMGILQKVRYVMDVLLDKDS